jgi:hypothetical protein
MNKISSIFCLTAFTTILGQNITHVDNNTTFCVGSKALFYNTGSFQTKGNGTAEILGKIMLVSNSNNDTFKAIDGNNKNFYLRFVDKNKWNDSQFGQIFIKGFSQNNITASVNKEFVSNKHGDYQQIGIPFFDKVFTSLGSDLNAEFNNSRWSRKEILKWNNDFARFDGSIIPPSQITSNSTPGISILLNDRTKLTDRGVYFTVGTEGGLNPETFSILQGIPFADNLKINLTPQSINYGTAGNSTNLYREKYNTYLSDIFEIDNPWQQTYGKYIYQFSNPFLTNIDLSMIGIDETLFGATVGDNNNIKNLWGISVNPSNVKFNNATGTTSSYSANQIVTFGTNNRPVGNIDCLIVKPLGTFKIKLRDNNPAVLDFDNLRRFSNRPRSETTSYNVVASKSNDFNSIKQLGVILLNENKDQIGETYFVVSNDFKTGNNQYQNNNSVQAIATPANLISTYEEALIGGVDTNFSSKYRLYINEANEQNFTGKALNMALYSGGFLKFQIRENSKILGDSENLSSGKSFYFKKPDGQLTEIKQGDQILIDSQNYTLYYGKPDITLDSSVIKPNRTVVTYDNTIESNIVLFDPNWIKADIKVFDITGKLIIDKKSVSTKSNFVIEVNKNIKSTYLITIVSDKGEIVNSKFITR